MAQLHSTDAGKASFTRRAALGRIAWWVIFNSSRSGFPHIYAARVPDGLLDSLSRTA
jgi:hypothetical protein